jgi:thymidylate synthase (FAD)
MMQQVVLVNITPDPIHAIARAARVSHRSEGGDDEGLVRKLIKWGHLSPLEFADATFLIEGMTHQLVRHRHLSFVQESLRHTEADREMVWPDSFGEKIPLGVLDAKVRAQIKALRDTYNELVYVGVPPEDARFIMPQGLASRLIVKGNFRAWREVIQKRALNPHAQWEIREATGRILELLYEQAPAAFEDCGRPRKDCNERQAGPRLAVPATNLRQQSIIKVIKEAQ